MNEKDKYTRGILADTLANWDTVKFFTAEQREQARYGAAIKEYQRSEYRVIASLNALNLIQNGVISLGLVAGSCIVAFSVVQGQRSVGDFVLFTSYLQQLYGREWANDDVSLLAVDAYIPSLQLSISSARCTASSRPTSSTRTTS